MGEMSCEFCGAPMVRRTARKGPNAGKDFFGCQQWRPSEQHSTWNLDDARALASAAPARNPPVASGPRTAAPIGPQVGTRKVHWQDASTTREGWNAQYLGGGASLRSWPGSVQIAAREHFGVAWMAVQDLPSFEAADDDTRRVLGMMKKIVQRGLCPPVPPVVEADFLRGAGVEVLPVPNSLGVRPANALDQTALLSAVRWLDPTPIDARLELGSSEEDDFLRETIPRVLGSDAIAWTVAQAPLDVLLRSLGKPSSHARRVDFLFIPPGRPPFVVEVDGTQHADELSVDADRDAALGGIGVEVHRVSAAALREGADTDLAWLADRRTRGAAFGAFNPLIHGPVQAHRLILALLESVRRGFLAGGRWSVSLLDGTDLALQAMPSYLSMLAAVDALWGGHVAPFEVVVRSGDSWRHWIREGFTYVEVDPVDHELDVEIRLEISRSPLHELESPGNLPTVVVRSARLPVELLETTAEPAVRVPPRVDSEAAAGALHVLLQHVFAKPDFREGQLEAVLEIFHGRDSVVLLPTGAGKSLIYQLAGLCLPGRTLVIDPLIALIEDQIRGLAEHGIDRVVGISAATTAAGLTEQALEQVAAGDALFVFVAPERLQQAAFRDALRQLAVSTPINLAVVDEAHCVSEWGHAFRTSYLNLGKVIHNVCRDAGGVPPPILALTGTASRAVLRDVLAELRIELRSASTLIRPRTFDRPELSFEILPTRPAEASSTLAGLLRGLAGRFGVSDGEFFRSRKERTQSGLVFAPHVDGDYGVVKVAERISSVIGIAVPFYAGGSPKGFDWRSWDDTKRLRARDFIENANPLLVTTNAFGMGIDKPNIRYVIHYGIPGSIEAYYQEVGRSGRDGHPAKCFLIMSEFDEASDRALLDEDVDLEQARAARDAESRRDSDDVHRQLYFHFSSFAGLDVESGTLLDVLAEIGEVGRARSVVIPMASGDTKQRAIHRLVLLGLIDDYLVDWGAKKFTITLRSITAQDVTDAFLRYVEASQPGRSAQFSEGIALAGWRKPEDALRGCAPLLIAFVYDTIERARRRSLREMWLAARESIGEPEQLRRRILDFLSEGDLAPRLEKLVDESLFSFDPWLSQLQSLLSAADAREWRGTTARLLASYPDHPGLLVGRAVSELLDPDGNLREFASNVEAAVRSAVRRYGASLDDVNKLISWLYERAVQTSDAEGAAVILAVAGLELDAGARLDGLDSRGAIDFPGSVSVAAVMLSHRLRKAISRLDTIVEREGTI